MNATLQKLYSLAANYIEFVTNVHSQGAVVI